MRIRGLDRNMRRSGGALSLTARAMAAIRRARGAVLLAGLPRNYFDSVGTTPATVDNPDGLVLDAAGVLGPNAFQEAAVVFGGESTRVSPGVYRVYSSAGVYSSVSVGAGLTPYKTYRLRFFQATATAGSLSVDGPAGAVTSFAGGVGEKECVITMTATTTVSIKRSGGVTDIQISNVRIEELTGSHASQPTVGSKPTLRRGLVNQLLYSQWGGGGTAPTGWLAFGAGGIEGALLPSGMRQRVFTSTASRDFIYSSVSLAANTVYTVAVYVDANPNNAIASNILFQGSLPVGAGMTVADTVPAAGSFIVGTITIGANAGSVTLRVGLGTSNVVTGSVTLSAPAVFQGTATAQQILDAGGIPLTTTASASSANGKYWWQFDPAAPGDFFGTGITTTDTGWVCAGVTLTTGAPANQSIAYSGADADINAGAWLAISGGSIRYGVGNGTSRNTLFGAAVSVGVPHVVDGGHTATNIFCGLDGVEQSAAKTVNCTTSRTLRIGMTEASWPLQGGMSVQVICPTFPPPADRDLIRRWVKSLQA